jgi:hypothetical protein
VHTSREQFACQLLLQPVQPNRRSDSVPPQTFFACAANLRSAPETREPPETYEITRGPGRILGQRRNLRPVALDLNNLNLATIARCSSNQWSGGMVDDKREFLAGRATTREKHSGEPPHRTLGRRYGS